MNTQIDYLYRDADNYKCPHTVILEGEPDEELIDRIIDTLYEGEYFVPDCLGWPWGMDGYGADSQSDHPMCELCREDFSATDDEPTVNMSLLAATETFERCDDIGWLMTDGYIERMAEIEGL